MTHVKHERAKGLRRVQRPPRTKAAGAPRLHEVSVRRQFLAARRSPRPLQSSQTRCRDRRIMTVATTRSHGLDFSPRRYVAKCEAAQKSKPALESFGKVKSCTA